MNYVLAIDQGTSSSRAMIYNTKGELIKSSQYLLTQYYPDKGWVEHDPEEIWQKTIQAIKDVVAQVDAKKILCCGITNQRETTLIWDKRTGECLSPAIVWQDRRTEELCQSLSSHSKDIHQKTGLVIDPYFSASKIHWLLKNNQKASELAKQGHLAVGTVDTFLIWRLTKGAKYCTDLTNASRTMLLNIHSQNWDSDLLALFEVPNAILPQINACDGDFGSIHKDIIGYEIPITGVAGDQQAALIGQGCFKSGMIKSTFGTGGFLLLNTGRQVVMSDHKLLTTISYKIKDQIAYGLEGSIYHAGTTVKWLRDEMKLISNASDTEALAQSLESNDGVYFVSSFTGLGAPHWLSLAGACAVGLSRSTTPAHFARAALEGVCYQTRDILSCMREETHSDMTLMRVDGGMAANQWFLQFLADQCQITIQKPKDIETTARGAAVLSAIGFGVFDSLVSISKIWELDREFEPSSDKVRVDSDYRGWMRALEMVKSGQSTGQT